MKINNNNYYNWNMFDRLLKQQNKKNMNIIKILKINLWSKLSNIQIVKVICYSIQLFKKKCYNKQISKVMK